MKKISFFGLLIGLFLLTTASFAHQPRIVSEEMTQIENPEVSQAFYAELKGEPDYYQIKSEEPFKLYVGILVPDLEGIDKDVSVDIRREDLQIGEKLAKEHEEVEPLVILSGLEYEWTRWYEPFGGDWHWEGPEFRGNSPDEELPEGVKVNEGIYTLKVFSPDNEGKYVLAVGEREEFPIREMIQTLFVLPQLKAEFFKRSPWTAYFNLVGVFLVISIGILVAIIVAVVILVKKVRRIRRLKGGNNEKRR